MLCCTALLLLPNLAIAGPPSQDAPSKLTIDRIFASSEFSERAYGPVDWSADGKSYTRLEPAKSPSAGQELVRYDAATGARSIVVAGERLKLSDGKPLNVESYSLSSDSKRLLIYTNSARVWRQNTRGDYWVLEIATGTFTKLGTDAKPSTLQFAKFSPDGRRVGYVRENNIYVEDASGGHIQKLTKDGSNTTINGTSDWVNEEELEIRDAWRWSPNGRSIAYWQFDTTGVKKYTLVNYTYAKYPIVKTFPYPKTGEKNSAVRVGVVSSTGGSTRWLDIPGDPRNNYIARMHWTPDGRDVALIQLNRHQNHARIFLADPGSGKAHPVLEETDDTWVDFLTDFVPGGMQWIDGGRSFLWASERNGWRHIYRVSRRGSIRSVTHGDFDVDRVVGTDEANGWLYFIASPDSAVRRYLFRARLDGSGDAERVTPSAETGVHRYEISPNGKWAAHSWSNATLPPLHELVRLPEHSRMRVLEDNHALVTALKKVSMPTVELTRVDVGEGVQLDTWIVKPPDFDPSKSYPLFIEVYGEPAGVTVLDEWGLSTSMWHCMLAQQGYVIASMDNRGTPSLRGRAWRRSVYRKIGVLASQDQAAGVKALCRLPYIDSSRVGVWGWSGGATMTLNAMFRYPELYKVGMAVAPVPNMELYDTIYQERYMGLPQENPEDYRRGSPITYAKNLAGDLLIVHGTGDDNVHYQGTEKLINALVAANKPFTVMPYPNRSHGIFEGENTTRHLFSLLTRFLNEHLPAGPR